MAQLMPLPLTVSCFSKIQIGFTFLVSAHLGSPGKRAVKRVMLLTYLVVRPCESETPLLALLALQQDLCICPSARLSVYPSVSPSNPPHAAAAGLLLWARLPGGIDRLLHGRRSAAAAPQHGAQQQMRAVPRCQLTWEAEHRLFSRENWRGCVLRATLCQHGTIQLWPQLCLCLSVSARLSVTSHCCIQTTVRIELVFGTEASFHLSYAVL